MKEEEELKSWWSCFQTRKRYMNSSCNENRRIVEKIVQYYSWLPWPWVCAQEKKRKEKVAAVHALRPTGHMLFYPLLLQRRQRRGFVHQIWPTHDRSLVKEDAGHKGLHLCFILMPCHFLFLASSILADLNVGGKVKQIGRPHTRPSLYLYFFEWSSEWSTDHFDLRSYLTNFISKILLRFDEIINLLTW